MGKLPILSGAKMIKILEGIGFSVIHVKGSHWVMRKGEYRTVVPLHDELSKGTLMDILKQCGLTKEDLERILERG